MPEAPARPLKHGWEVYAPGGVLIGTANDVGGALRLYRLVYGEMNAHGDMPPEVTLALWSEGRLVELLWWRLR